MGCTMPNTVNIATHVVDMIDLEKSNLAVVVRQVDNSDFNRFPDTASHLNAVRALLTEQIARLEQQLDDLGGTPVFDFQAALTRAGRETTVVREPAPSRAIWTRLRENQSALMSTAVGYETLFVAAMAAHAFSTAALAMRHLKQITAMVRQGVELLPEAVTIALAEDDPTIDIGFIDDASQSIVQAWAVVAAGQSSNLELEQFAGSV